MSPAQLTFAFLPFPWTRFTDIEELAGCVTLAEELGFEGVNLPSHLLVPAWPDARPSTKLWYDPITLAAFLAARTARIVVETHVLALPYYSPIALAKALATTDVLSRGRLRVGVGTGWMRAEFRRLGIDYARRGAMTDESLRAMRELWSAPEPRFDGEWVAFDDVSFLPRPTRREGPPIIVGGSSPAALRRVAEFGHGWHPLDGGPDGVARGLERLDELMAERGRRVADLRVGCTFAAGDDPDLEAMTHDPGAADGRGAHVPAGRTGRGRRPARACIDGIAALAEAGVTHVVVTFAWRDAASLHAELRWFARDVMPAFR